MEAKTMNSSFNLEKRCLNFANDVVQFTANLPKLQHNLEYSKQVIRSAGSVGANYLEANEGLSRKDFVLRIKIAKKEAKETRYWLQLLSPTEEHTALQQQLMQESTELIKIFSAIAHKAQTPKSSS